MAQEHVYVIAEAGVNHNGSLEMAKKMVAAAAQAGADAIKFQMFKTENLMTRYAPKAKYQLSTTDETESQFDMTKKLELNVNDHKELIKTCKQYKIDYFATPFDVESLYLLVNECGLNRIKIPSGEVTNAPFLLEVARTGKPVILSTGMCTLGEIEIALGVLAFGYLYKKAPKSIDDFVKCYYSAKGQAALKKNVSLFHCTTEYPAPYDSANLRCMETMKKAFGLPIGYSDHTKGIAITLASVALGAVIIEKHFTLDRNLSGPDQKASIEPHELEDMVVSIRAIEQCMGNGIKLPSQVEQKNMSIARKSLVAKKDIKKSEVFTDKNLDMKRPGDGLSPLQYWYLLNKQANKNYLKDEKVELV